VAKKELIFYMLLKCLCLMMLLKLEVSLRFVVTLNLEMANISLKIRLVQMIQILNRIS